MCVHVGVCMCARARCVCVCVCVASLLVFKDSAIVQSIYNEIASMTRNVDYVVRKKIRVSGIKYICVCVYIYIYIFSLFLYIYIYIYK